MLRVALVGGILGAFGGGYWWGSSTADAAIHRTEAGLQAAFNQGPDAARTWLNLMTWNRIDDALGALSRQGDRLACNRRPRPVGKVGTGAMRPTPLLTSSC